MSQETAIIPNVNGIGWTEAEYDSNGTLKIQDKEDVSSILKVNAFLRNSGGKVDFGEGTQTSGRLLGTISPLQMQMLVEQGIFWDDDKLRKWFKDLDNYMWTVQRGK
jgi:hypothetical protein